MEFFWDFLRVFRAGWRDALKFLWAYLTLRTRFLLEISERGTPTQQRQFFLLLFSSLVVGVLFAALLNGKGIPEAEAAPALVSIFLGMAAVGAPFFIAHWFTRRSLPYFVANVILAQLFLLTVAVGWDPLIRDSVEPAGTEFKMFRDKIGKGTLVYERTCGLIEAYAEQLVLMNAVTIAAVRREAQFRKLRAARPIDPQQRANFLQEGRAYSTALDRTSRRMQALAAQAERTERLYSKRYPSARVGQAFVFLLKWLGLALTLLHLVKGILYSPGPRGGAIAKSAVVAVCLLASIGIGSASLKLGHYQTMEDLDPATFVANIENSPDLSQTLATWQNMFQGERNRLRVLAHDFEHECGAINSHGLW